MDNLVKIRQIYFIGLFSSIIYIALLIIILKKTPMKEPNGVYTLLLGLVSIVLVYPLLLKVKKRLFEVKQYKLAAIALHLPLILGFAFSLIDKNYVYLFMSFPVFLIGYIIIMPVDMRR